MEVTFLGTASGYPTPSRCVSCVAIRAVNEDSVWIFDCGEGSQIQLMKSNIKPGKISKVFVTHLHGDHVFGLPGLLCTVSQNNQRQEPVHIFGPRGLRQYLRVSLGLSRSELGFSFVVHELEPLPCQLSSEFWDIQQSQDTAVHPNEQTGSIIMSDHNEVWTCLDDESRVVQAVWVQHRVPCFAYVIKEKDRPGRLDVAKLRELGVPPGPLYGQIKSGQRITLPSGIQVSGEDVLGPSQKGLLVVIGGDSSDSSQLMKVAQGANLLIHEATLENSLKESCVLKGHSTPNMTAELAKRLGVDHLILTHFSQRYRPISAQLKDSEVSVQVLLEEAQEVLGDRVTCSEDLMVYNLKRTYC